MFKKWITRIAITCAVGVGIIAGTGSAALAGDTWLILSDIDGRQVGAMQHVDDGDSFRVYDSLKDGYSVEGCLQTYTPRTGWVTLRCKNNDSGAGTYESFSYDVITGLIYRMRLCHALVPCAYQGFNE
ncbi:hypothetical protein [Glycomyces artemisiae]|uniref:Uncharacterized protein n=1 Tax=Glycomyces artemisiae TaxID=1076443 RepID=A0A2T0UPT1_9ACTN|nr:hypothetical protein [Glycomyces artemisiae]PRY59935.1 hypothetical protein B0I28_103409 [Glycomyces artemisiae]